MIALIKRDRELHYALQRSRRAGDLLLKSEEAELQAVDALAKQLLQSEYRWAAWPSTLLQARGPLQRMTSHA